MLKAATFAFMALSNNQPSDEVRELKRAIDELIQLTAKQCEVLSRCETNRPRLVASIEQAEQFGDHWRGDLFNLSLLQERTGYWIMGSPEAVTAQALACTAIEGAHQNRNVLVGFDDLSDGVNPQDSMSYATFCEVGRLMNGKITRYEIQNQENSSVDRPPRLVSTTDYFNEIFSRDNYPIHLSQKKYRYNIHGGQFDWFIVYNAHKTCIPQAEYYAFLRQQAAVLVAYGDLLNSLGSIASDSSLFNTIEDLRKLVSNPNAELQCTAR